ncbi:MAG: triose-phosphate transporter family-domain-containing protein [Monoraphidium minutum]|nr:MAG: triose-phosphate transporter family-domain-containing protein [Monoraphidium minutum]
MAVLFLNKYLLSNSGFRQPCFLTLCHMAACCGLSYALSAAGAFPIRPLRSRRQGWNVFILSAIFCLTIVLGNWSLKHIAVSFNQAVGAGTAFFTAAFAYTLQGARETRATYLTLIPIAGGVALASGGEPQLHLLGFAACLAATALRALKSVVQAMLMSDPSEKLDPMSLLFYMSGSPARTHFSIALLIPTTALLEPGSASQAAAMAAAGGGFLPSLLINSSMAYAVNLTNFLVTKYTSALTLQVLGNLKGVIAAAVSIALFRNPVTAKGLLGYAITVAGVFMYSNSKRKAKAEEDAEPAAGVGGGGGGGEPLLPKSRAPADSGGGGLGYGGADGSGGGGGGGGAGGVDISIDGGAGGGGTLPGGAGYRGL